MQGPAAFDSLNTLKLPDLWQQEAVRHLKSGIDVILDAPTGAGKTYVFECLVESRALRGQAVYTVPTRALANDKRIEWQQRGWSVGIATGDLAENLEAPVIVATLETQRERLFDGRGPALLVIDEYQMIADPVRGARIRTVHRARPRRNAIASHERERGQCRRRRGMAAAARAKLLARFDARATGSAR